MANSYFRFKQFTVHQSQSAMKVGTDGVLLGAWCAVSGTERRILDIGTGTGLIALMMAQRNQIAVIDAIDVDEGAFQQASANAAASLWSSRINAYHVSLQDFQQQSKTKYDLIVSNPPYFINSLKSPELARMAARHTEMLPHDQLAQGVARLLNNNGKFFAIFPYEEGNVFVAQAALHRLYCNARMEVHPAPDKPVKRIMLEFGKQRAEEVRTSKLIIDSGTRHDYTPEYRKLTGDFYLNF